MSVDNLFVFIIILGAFRVPREYLQKALMYGIIIALVLRFVFIALGAVLISQFSWVFYLFGAFLIYTAINQVREAISKKMRKRTRSTTKTPSPPGYVSWCPPLRVL